MRRLAILMPALVGAAAIASLVVSVIALAAPGLAPPVIHESWTPLPCPAHPQTTIAIEGCGERAVSRSDHTIDGLAAAIFHLIRDASDRKSFVSGELSWLSYRRHSCRAAASSSGGSNESVVYVLCEKSVNQRHIADLRADHNDLQTP